jgi:hypothetical protein
VLGLSIWNGKISGFEMHGFVGLLLVLFSGDTMGDVCGGLRLEDL